MATTVKIPSKPDNYMIPSALSIWFAPFRDDGSLCSYFDLGNVMDIALTFADTYAEHKSARNGLLATDKYVVSEVNADLKFTIDELVGNNLTLMFRPNVTPDTTAIYTIKEQKRFKLVGLTATPIDPKATENSSVDYLDLFWEDDTVDDVLVRSTDGSITYVEGTDYTFTQAVAGTGGSPATIARTNSGGIASGQEILVTYNYYRNTTSYQIQTGAVLEGALVIQALNRIGPLFAYEFPFVSFGIDGDMTINPAEYIKQAFSVKVLTAGNGVRAVFHLFDKFEKLSALACA